MSLQELLTRHDGDNDWQLTEVKSAIGVVNAAAGRLVATLAAIERSHDDPAVTSMCALLTVTCGELRDRLASVNLNALSRRSH